MTNFNERTNTLLYKNIYLTLYYRKGWCWLCVRGELETGADCYILTPSSSDHCSTSFAFWLGCSTVGHWGPKDLSRLLTLNSASCLNLTATLTATAAFRLIYTGASLDWRLGRGSICYITFIPHLSPQLGYNSISTVFLQGWFWH